MIENKVKAPAEGLSLYDVIYDSSIYNLHDKTISDVEKRYYDFKRKK